MKTERRTPVQKAARTAKWATIMAKWGVTWATGGHRSGKKKDVSWQLVDFPGANGGESRGIVDALAIRKDHRPGEDGLERGDRFEIILLQIKGGGARNPSADDNLRMWKVAQTLRAEAVLVRWKLKQELTFSRLKKFGEPPVLTWEEVKEPSEIFGRTRNVKAFLNL
jgi:hypothetical protein